MSLKAIGLGPKNANPVTLSAQEEPDNSSRSLYSVIYDFSLLSNGRRITLLCVKKQRGGLEVCL